MGKEAKIGLATIGVLVSIFAVLLFRHLSADDPATAFDTQQLASTPTSQGDEVDAARMVVAHEAAEASAAGTPPADVPAASYMPADEGAPVADRYARLAPEDAPAPPAGTGSPFQRVHAGAAAPPEAVAAGIPDADAPGAGEPISDGTVRAAAAPAPTPQRNPLRRLSAELPLDGADHAVEPAMGAALPDPAIEPQTPQDRYSADAYDALPEVGQYSDAPLDTAEAPLDEPAGGALERSPRADPFEAPLEAAAPRPGSRRPSPTRAELAPDGADWQTPGDLAARAQSAGPLPLENGVYTVQPNDTFWSISEKVYGTGGYFKAVAAHNRGAVKRPNDLQVGVKVAVPPASQLEALYPSLCPKQRQSRLVQGGASQTAATSPRSGGGDVYVVVEGDTLFDIARYELGQAARWAEIYELNRDQLGEDFDYLRPGVELRMPPRSRAEQTTGGRSGDARYLR